MTSVTITKKPDRPTRSYQKSKRGRTLDYNNSYTGTNENIKHNNNRQSQNKVCLTIAAAVIQSNDERCCQMISCRFHDASSGSPPDPAQKISLVVLEGMYWEESLRFRAIKLLTRTASSAPAPNPSELFHGL